MRRFNEHDVPGGYEPGPGRRPPMDVGEISERDIRRIWRTALDGHAAAPPEPALVFTVAVHGDTLRFGWRGEGLDAGDLIAPLLFALGRIGCEQELDLLGMASGRVAAVRRPLPDDHVPMVSVRLDRAADTERN